MKVSPWLRIFLLWLLVPGVLVALLIAWIWSLEGPSAGGRFTILQVNDIYRIEGIEKRRRGGLARLRTLRRQLEERGPVLVLHAGDMFGPAVLSKKLRSRPMVRCLNLLDGDASAFDPHLVATFGNHEFDDKDLDLPAARVLESDFSWVSSNLRFQWGRTTAAEPLGRRLPNVHEALLVEIGGVRVGILGLVLEDQKRPWLAVRYSDPGERNAAIRAAIDDLEGQGAQVLVALTHQAMEEDEKLAQSFPEIDLVVGGHEHTFHRKKVGRAWVTKADADAVSVMAIDVRLTPDGEVIAQPERIAVGQAIAPDPLVAAEVDAAFQEYDRIHAEAQKDKAEDEREPGREEVVARARNLLEGVEPAVRGRETALGNFLADVVRETMGADIGLIHGGSIRLNDNIPAGGELTGYDLDGIFYYGYELFAQGKGGKSPPLDIPKELEEKRRSFRRVTRDKIEPVSPGQPVPWIEARVEGRIERLDG